MTTETVKPFAEFVGYQKDDRVGGVRAWYIIKAPGFARHLSTVFAPTLVELKIPIPKHPPYFPESKFKSVWVFRCENDACHITYLSKDVVIEHVKETKHYQIVQELITTTQVKDGQNFGLINKIPNKAILIDKVEETQELDAFGDPVKQKKHKIVLIGSSGERLGFNSIKDSNEAIKESETVTKVVTSKVVDFAEQKPVKEKVSEEPEDAALAFRKKIHDQYPDVDWEPK